MSTKQSKQFSYKGRLYLVEWHSPEPWTFEPLSITSEQGQDIPLDDMPEMIELVFLTQRKDFQVMNPVKKEN